MMMTRDEELRAQVGARDLGRKMAARGYSRLAAGEITSKELAEVVWNETEPLPPGLRAEVVVAFGSVISERMALTARRLDALGL